MKSLRLRGILVCVVMLIGFVYLIPTMSQSLPDWWKSILPQKKINLGLDLQGGVHLSLEVQVEAAVQNAAERMAEEMKDSMRQARIPFTGVERAGGSTISVRLPSAEAQSELTNLISRNYPSLTNLGAQTAEEGMVIRYGFTDAEAERIRRLAADQALETIRNRIDQFGVSEPDIRPQGENRILIQLPGVQDPQRAIALIGKTAVLEFKVVAEDVSAEGIKSGRLPAGVRVYPMRHIDPASKQRSEDQIALRERTLLTGEYITNAQVHIDTQYQTPYVGLEFDSQGARIFDRVTSENVQKRLAIVLDNVVYSAPVIQERISGGKASITGSFTMNEARDLAIVLRAGALPAPVTILEQRTVGPSLGRDSIRRGLIAALFGGIATLIFMLAYYRYSGLVANAALLLNVPIILACLSALGATLTLPGIAGIILTVGMAVDANVLIFERIREELRAGKSPRAALEAGYDRATLTILDSNLTSLIAAIVLFQFGTGPVRGFAVTLSIGLLASLFTAIVVTRVIFDYFLINRRVRTISI